MASPGITTDDMSDEARFNLNCSLKEGLTPEGVFKDYGDSLSDHTAAYLAQTDGQAANASSDNGGSTTFEETETYRDSFQREDIRIL